MKDSNLISSPKKRKRTIAIITPIIVACIAFVIVLTTRIIPGQKLNKAMTLIDSGDYKAAYILLDSIDYKNSRELQESIKPQREICQGYFRLKYHFDKTKG